MVLLKITKPFDYRLDHNTTIAFQIGELQVEDSVAAKALEVGAGEIIEDFGDDGTLAEDDEYEA